MKRAIGTSLPEADHARLVNVCTTVAELFAANKVTIWSFEAQAGGSTTGLVTMVAGSTWDGRELVLDQRWNSVPVSELPTFSAAIVLHQQVSYQDAKRASGRQGDLMSAFGIISFDCEPIISNGHTVGVLMVDPPRVLETERAILLPVIVEEASFILSKAESIRYREEARFLLALIGRATSKRSIDHVLATVCDDLARHLRTRHATIFLEERLLPAGRGDRTPPLTPDGGSDAGAVRPIRRYLPAVSKRPNGSRDLKSWREFDAIESEVAGHLRAWAESDVPLESLATGWWKESFGASSLLGAPISIDDEPAGILLVDTEDLHQFSKSESYLVYEVSMVLGWIIAWARAELTADSVSTEPEAENAIGSRWLLGSGPTEERGTDEVVSAVSEAAVRIFGADVAYPVAASQAHGTGYSALPAVQQSLATGHIISVDDIWASFGSSFPSGTPVLRSVLTIPLGTGGRPWYVVACGSTSAPRDWSEDDRQLARHLSIEGSLRLEMARLARVDRHQVRGLAQRLLRDPLTNLPNTILLIDRIEQAINRAQRDKSPLAVMCVDIDRLHDVNEALGEDRGDMLLAQVANRLAESLRISDVVARVGGDEFAVLLTTSASPEGIRVVADKIQRVLALPFNLSGEMVMVTSKIGISAWPESGDDPAELLNRAFETMRRVAATHREGPPAGPLGEVPGARGEVPGPPPPTWFPPAAMPSPEPPATATPELVGTSTEPPFTDTAYLATSPAPVESVTEAVTDPPVGSQMPPHVVLQDLPRAIHDGELVLHYLPKVSLADGDVISMEALVRWVHPHYGMVSPSAFVPLLEDTELGWQLTFWVLNAAMDQCRNWLSNGLSLAVTVNVSRYDVTVAPLIDTVQETLARTHLLGRHLTLEISEQAVMDEMVRGSASLVILRSGGVRISIDDCGSGKVAPLYLARMPVDEIKIDNSLLTEGDPSDVELVKDIVRLGHDFGIEITAEAVEGFARADGIKRMGIDNIQGYHVAGPLLPENVLVWVNNHRSRTDNERNVLWTG